ncbi:cyclophilin-like fold protein [Pseudorhodoferax sp. Leaf267]|uniref:cyclophilin-like fold protein n=1 Tax=Pseudorhodoferax sp. Leaf267 TaxID=1736316 RepID=UPI0006F96171|nr:cyclophilin-like fold protein [Pseudorhodoferax sp. Leaf267]KQP19388.1 hypothetical protein ASF43_28810 [Pseudorhodoferax sp. Leaf267]
MKIRIVLGEQAITVALDGSAAARDFTLLLPLTLTLEDYAATAKIATLPRKLDTFGAPAGCTPQTGDFSYYAPWGNLALFHKPFTHSAGLVRLGRMEGDLALLRMPGPVSARLEAVSNAAR